MYVSILVTKEEVSKMPYTIGVDYGTQSGRVVLLNIDNGCEMAVSVVPYAHGVIDEILPTTGAKLPVDFALQHPLDYIDVLDRGIPAVLKESGINPAEVIGLGVDFTSCTVLPVNEDGVPLCILPGWQERPHAWPKLWKHHAAQPIADRINDAANKLNCEFLHRYGGRISSEWYFPKLIEVFEQDRDVYNAMFRFVEATDWVVWYLTGNECRNSCTAGYKAMWSEETGVPPREFFAAVNPDFLNPTEKLGDLFYPLGTRASCLRPDVASKLGLSPNVAVAVGNVDAMVSAPSVGLQAPGTFVMVMGTSICHLTITEQEILMPGITGVVKDGILPGFYGYEAGQAAVGDMFEWFVKRYVSPEEREQAKRKGLSIYEYLESEAEVLAPGESGLIALDWWNGNRSILSDADLSGVIVGLTLKTLPHELYRTLLESTAFGTKRILDNFAEHGIEITNMIACGGVAQKSSLLMQIYADVCGLPVAVCSSTEVPARGAAIFGAVAAGSNAGGFDSIQEAIPKLASPILKTYIPDPDRHRQYRDMYQIYWDLYDMFGRDRADWMHRLKEMRLGSSQTSKQTTLTHLFT